ncbi:unnamed protein product [marine sediment metagenome]|uniref:Uncharacterized protein n=1 Tax=marine sediment metagenome TaxID=412755 RepID=X1LQI3_9ZZZZ
MSTHKPDKTKRHQVNKQKRQQRKMARRKLLRNLTKDPRSGYKIRKER